MSYARTINAGSKESDVLSILGAWIKQFFDTRMTQCRTYSVSSARGIFQNKKGFSLSTTRNVFINHDDAEVF
jgi:hypothetical protein